MPIGEPHIPRQAPASVKEILAAVPGWLLRPVDWRDLDEITRDLQNALADGDDARLRRLTGEMLSIASVRVEERITDAEPMPEPIRERINDLLDTLDPPSRTPTAAEPTADGVES